MSVIALPPLPGVSSLQWTLERNVAVLESPLSRAAQRLMRSGSRWRAALQFPLYRDDDAGVLAAWYDQVSRGDRWLYLSPPQHSRRGTWAPAELITNGTFLTNTTGWAASGATLSVNARRIKVKNSGAAAGQAQQASIAVTANAWYALVLDRFAGSVANFKIEVRRQDTDALITSETTTTAGRSVILVNPPSTAIKVNLICNTTTAGDYVYFTNVSAGRCLLVNGASQVGNALNVDNGPASLDAALKAGEFFSVFQGSQYGLHRLTDDLDLDSAGAGKLRFEPALRASPADNDGVLVLAPYARFRVAEHLSAQAVSAPILHNFATEVVEDVTT